MKDQPIVSYVIPTYNGAEYIAQCLQSVFKQTWNCTEIIVIDDNSDDETRSIIREDFSAVKYIRLPSNHGHAGASNVGLANANGTYVALLDDDVELPRKWTEKLVEEFENKSENVALLQPRIVEPNRVKNECGKISTFQACGVLAKARPLEECGYYDDRYFVYRDDYQLAAELIHRGYEVHATNATETIHKSDKGGVIKSEMETFYDTRNMLWYYWQYYDYLRIPVFSLIWILWSGKTARKSGTLLSYLRALGSSLRGLDYLWTNHRTTRNLNYSALHKLLETVRG